MSGGVFCSCSGPLRERRLHWRVWQRMCNHSAFNGGRYTPSQWSEIHCLRCRGVWRTRASYAITLPDYIQIGTRG